MTIETTYTREQVIELLHCNKNARKSWIIQKLNEVYEEVTTVGRGKNIIFICKTKDNSLNTPQGAYKAFKSILIHDYGFGSSFNYNSVLNTIEFHINNTEPTKIIDIANKCGVSEKTIYNHRKKLESNIVKNKSNCEKIAMGRNSVTLIDEDISELYQETILSSFNNQMKTIHYSFNNESRAEVAVFTNSKNKSFEFVKRENIGFDFIKQTMEDAGNKLIGSYPVWHKDRNNNLYINKHLRAKVFDLVLKDFGYNFVYFLRIYEIHEDLKNDKELLAFIKKAIQYKNSIEYNMVA